MATQTTKDSVIVSQEEPDLAKLGEIHAREAAAAPLATPVPGPDDRGPLVRQRTEGSFSFDGSNYSVMRDGNEHPYNAEFTDFISRDPGLSLEMGDVVVRFQLGRVSVPAPLGERMKKHTLYANGKFYLADEVAILGGEIVSYRENAVFKENMEAAKRGDKVMYATKLNLNLVVNFGDFELRFQDGYAAADPDKVARIEQHVFFREQRITRL